MARPGRKTTTARTIEGSQRLAGFLQARRDGRGLSRPALAQATSVSPETIRRIEANLIYDPGFFTVLAMARALEFGLDELRRHIEAGGAR